ncbi:NACHT domain-containing protein [Nonomuraea sp. NPDC002799]
MAVGDSRGSWKYLYERLGEKRFQQLCGALLAHVFPDVTCFPVGQRDGGRDAVRRDSSRGSIVYQVKWANDRAVKSPVAWLDAAIRGEADNIRRLVAEGASQYVLLTSVAGTSQPRRGSMDQLEERLAEHSMNFGIPMTCWWEADLDARIDAAPKDLKFAYSDMLAGPDLVRCLIEDDRLQAGEKRLRALLLKVMATQWHEDEKVKFKQVDLDSHDLLKLFVDVEAEEISEPINRGVSVPITFGRRGDRSVPQQVGGAVAYLLAARHPFTLVRGEPGQGKSTLGQFLCQVHRAAYLGREADLATGMDQRFTVTRPRLAVRADLTTYSAWVAGEDPLSADDRPVRGRRRRREQSSFEQFLVYLLQRCSGGMQVTVEMVHEIVERFPLLLVLDGLDEVAQSAARSRLVTEISQFAARLTTSSTAPQLVVTTRPSAMELAEPSTETFQILSLVKLGNDLRVSYLRKWSDARGIRGAARRALQRIFDERSSEPHITQLASNPMHLTILLYLMHKRGEAVPDNRTDLYSSYMETFLDRETEKSALVRQHRPNLEEVTAFLGWHLQSRAERNATEPGLSIKDIKKAINGYLFDVGKDVTLADDLFTGVTDRVWALASKAQGTFEFDVQSVREYFAARYLYDYAATRGHETQRSTLLQHLLSRPYWLNTARFYAGFATANELPGLAEGLEELLEGVGRAGHVWQAAWTLLTDGVFAARPKTQRRAAVLFADDLAVRLLAVAIDTNEDLPRLSADYGGIALTDALCAQVASNPDGPLSAERMRVVAWLDMDSAFDTWWRPHIDAALGTSTEPAWLRLAIPVSGGRHLSGGQIERLTLNAPGDVVSALAAGVNPPPGSVVERRMVESVLNGLCSDQFTAGAQGHAADLLCALAPQHFLAMARDPLLSAAASPPLTPPAAGRRTDAWRRLRQRDVRMSQLQNASKFSKWQNGTTSPWGNTARAIKQIFGPCWLAAEIAVIGAASSDRRWTTGGDRDSGSACLGADPDYGYLLQSLRGARRDTNWWLMQLAEHGDPLSRATWALALISVADPTVVKACLAHLDDIVVGLSAELVSALLGSSSRLGIWGTARRLPIEILPITTAVSPACLLLIAHHLSEPAGDHDIYRFSTQQLTQMASFGEASWPVYKTLAYQIPNAPIAEYLTVLRALGPTVVPLIPAQDDLLLEPRVVECVREDLAAQILQEPSSYPFRWVAVAEHRKSTGHGLPPLADLAAAQNWFAE